MPGRTVQLRVGGQTYRVVTTASEEELLRLAAAVDQKLAAVVPPGRAITPQAMLLAAMALAHDLEEERARAAAITSRTRVAYGRMLERVDAALGDYPPPAEASPGTESALSEPRPPPKPPARLMDTKPSAKVGNPQPPAKVGDAPRPPAKVGDAKPLTFTGRPRPANEP
jgi:cell division protein ZapA